MEDFDEDVWKIVTELGQEERHFNAVQHHYRLLASTWLLAMFGGIGFALAAEGLSVPPELIVLLLGLACATGITQLWNLDIRVYHQLLDSCFVQGLELERRYPWLPRFRSSMMASQTRGSTAAEETAPKTSPPTPKGVLARVVWFYIVGNSVSLLVALAGAILLLRRSVPLPPALLVGVAVVGLVIIAIWGYEMFRRTRSPLLEQWSRSQGKDQKFS